MKIDIATIKELAENIEKYNLEEVTLEVDGVKLTLKKEAVTQMMQTAPQVVTTQAPRAVAPKAVAVADTSDDDTLEAVLSPMVGTFYSSPSPDADVFVKVGTEVKAGDTLCIIEAMKLMNEVKATKSGRIAKILKVDGNGVAKGDKLFLMD